MRVLVTGATGKVGNAVARALADRGDEVIALVRDPEAARDSLPPAVTVIEGDVTEAASLAPACEGIEGAFNCMGIYEQWTADDSIFERVNALGARNVVTAASRAGARRVVHTSTFDVFAAERGGTVSETSLAEHPKGTAYERSKQRAEELVLELAGEVEVVIVNPSAVYGPGPWAEAGLDSMIRDAIRKRLPAVPPGGMTLVHVDDVAAAHLAAFDRGSPGERYILADGFATVPEIAAVAVGAAGRGRVPRTLPGWGARLLAGGGEAVARVSGHPPLLARGQLHFLAWEARADSSKARVELGAAFRPWSEGIAETARWIVSSGRV